METITISGRQSGKPLIMLLQLKEMIQENKTVFIAGCLNHKYILQGLKKLGVIARSKPILSKEQKLIGYSFYQ